MKKKTKTSTRAGVPGRTSKRSPTAATSRTKRAADKRRPTFEVWGTIAYGDRNPGGHPSVCLWGSQESAMSGRDADENVCLVRVEVLEVLDEPAEK